MREHTGVEHITATPDSSDPNRIIFGECRRCSGEPEGGFPDLDGDDARRDTDQKQKLVLYRGEWMCPRCRKNLIMDQESLIKSDVIRDEKLFLARAGFSETI